LGWVGAARSLSFGEDWAASIQKAYDNFIAELHRRIARGESIDDEDTLAELLKHELTATRTDLLSTPIDELKEQIDEAMTTALKENVAVFSKAKTYDELRKLTDLLTDADGALKSFADFKSDANEIYAAYEVNYLRAEYNHAVSSAVSISRWQQFQEEKDAVGNLEYSTTGDERVRDTHEALDGIIRPIDDDFWKTHYPPNGWNCRCHVIQTNSNTLTDLSTKSIAANDPMFNFNPAIDGIIFPEKHPYFNQQKT
jgi:SPP1 gp7 family putative phage head morphogenesis protein